MDESRIGRCGKCEYLCLDDSGKMITGRCNARIMPKGKGMTLGSSKQRVYWYEDQSREEAILHVQAKCNELLSPSWCPLNKGRA